MLPISLDLGDQSVIVILVRETPRVVTPQPTMIHRFDCAFSPTETLTLGVDMAQTPAAFAAHPMGLAAKYPTQYKQWLHEVVVPGLLELAKQEQVEAFAEKGREVA